MSRTSNDKVHWRAVCEETRKHGSEGGGWKRDALGSSSLQAARPPLHTIKTNPEISRTLASLLPNGDPGQLDRMLQAYAVEKTRIEALKRGHSVTEQSLSDGSIKMVIRVGVSS